MALRSRDRRRAPEPKRNQTAVSPGQAASREGFRNHSGVAGSLSARGLFFKLWWFGQRRLGIDEEVSVVRMFSFEIVLWFDLRTAIFEDI